MSKSVFGYFKIEKSSFSDITILLNYVAGWPTNMALLVHKFCGEFIFNSFIKKLKLTLKVADNQIKTFR